MEYFVDLSEYQGNVDFKKLKEQGINFVILRSTKKYNRVDKRFYQNVTDCIEHGISFDVYKYLYATNVMQAVDEANSLVEELIGMGICDSNLTVWLDIEDPSLPYYDEQLMKKIIIKFREIIENYDMTFGIYTSKYIYEKQFLRDIHGKFWLARYVHSNSTIDTKYVPDMRKCPVMRENDTLIGWQFTSKARLDGISGVCDLSIFT